MKAKRQQKNRSALLIRLVIVAAVAFCFFKLVQTQMQIESKEQEILALEQQKSKAMIINEDLQNKNDNAEGNIEQHLRSEGLVGSSDQVYVITNNPV